jgi:hypothetical protein
MTLESSVSQYGESVEIQSDRARSVRAPWIERPFQLVSWWEMEKFSAVEFYKVGELLARIEAYGAIVKDQKSDEFVEDWRREFIAESVLNIKESCSALVLGVSTKSAAHFSNQLQKQITWGNLQALCGELERLIQWEIGERLFLYIPPKRAEKYHQPDLFGAEVRNAFPSAGFDIEESGNCFAAGRFTASVMHLGRVVEVALRTLAESELGLPHRHDWGKSLSDIEKELEKRYKAAGARTPDEMFYAESAAQIGHIKTAWRNPTMHVDRIYTEEIAEAIMGAIKSFMRHLADRIHE